MAGSVTVNEVPKAEASPELLRELGMDDTQPKEPKMTIPERQTKLMEILENGGLDMLKDWPEEEACKA